MSKRRKPRGKVGQIRTAAAGVPVFAPTAERLARGEFEMQDQTEYVYDRDETGDRSHGRKVVMGQVYKDRRLDLRTRLARYRDIRAHHIIAAERYEQDWNTGAMEVKVTANLLGVGGGSDMEGLSGAVIDARTRILAAQNILSGCGLEMLRVVQAVVITGATSHDAARPKYADPEKGRVYVAALLEGGLQLLAAHYRLIQTNTQPQNKLDTGAPSKASVCA